MKVAINWMLDIRISLCMTFSLLFRVILGERFFYRRIINSGTNLIKVSTYLGERIGHARNKKTSKNDCWRLILR